MVNVTRHGNFKFPEIGRSRSVLDSYLFQSGRSWKIVHALSLEILRLFCEKIANISLNAVFEINNAECSCFFMNSIDRPRDVNFVQSERTRANPYL